ncbi:MAG: sulfotransferase [Solirubrobacteraceae bacterium]|jgi:hypothetical protein
MRAAAATLGADRAITVGFVLGAARSGTTLVRHLLDAHPDIACPPEAGIPQLARSLGRTWLVVTTDEAGARATRAAADVLEEIRATINVPVQRYCRTRGKRIYFDKSIDSADCLEILGELFPTAPYVVVYRHVMDVIASGLAASPFGFRGYGYERFVDGSSANWVQALASAWLYVVTRTLDWERRAPDTCHRVRYEDMVLNPIRAVSALHEFVGVSADTSVVRRGLANARQQIGPGDHKIQFTAKLQSESIGTGKRVPVSMISPELLLRVNACLAELGYTPLDAAWGMTPWSETALLPDRPECVTLAQRLERAMLPTPGTAEELGRFAVIADDRPGFRWLVDPEAANVSPSDEEAGFVICGRARDLLDVLDGIGNLGDAVRAGRIRCDLREAAAARAGDDGRPSWEPMLLAAVDALR